MSNHRNPEPAWEALRDVESTLLSHDPHSRQTVAERALEVAGMGGDEFLLASSGHELEAGRGHLTVAEQALLYGEGFDALNQRGKPTGGADPRFGFGGDPVTPDE